MQDHLDKHFFCMVTSTRLFLISETLSFDLICGFPLLTRAELKRLAFVSGGS